MSIPPPRLLALAATVLALLPTAQAQIWREDPTFAPEIAMEANITSSLVANADTQNRFILDGATMPLTHVDGHRHSGLVRLQSDGTLDPTLPGQNWELRPIVHFTTSDGGMWVSESKIWYGGPGSGISPIDGPTLIDLTTTLRKLLSDGTPDPTAIEVQYTAGGAVLLPDDSIVVYEADDPIASSGSNSASIKFSRYLANGVLDPTYTIALESICLRVRTVLVDTTGNVVVWRQSSAWGTRVHELIRLTSGGEIDTAFHWRIDNASIDEMVLTADRVVTRSGTWIKAYGFDGQLFESTDIGQFRTNSNLSATGMRLDSSRRIYVSVAENGSPRYVLRLKPDLTVDHTWPSSFDSSSRVDLLAVGSDHTLLLRENSNDQIRLILADENRWDPVGHQFARRVPGFVSRILPHADTGGVSIWGDFNVINGQPFARGARFQADGTLDPDFSPPAAVPLLGLRNGGWIAGQYLSDSFEYVHISPSGEVSPMRGLSSEYSTQGISWLCESRSGELMISRADTSSNVAQTRIEALNLDGSVAWSFTQPLEPTGSLPSYMILDGLHSWATRFDYVTVRQLIELSDGSWLLSTLYNAGVGDQVGLVFRFGADGTPTPNFTLDQAPDFITHDAYLRSDGSILLSGHNRPDLTRTNQFLLFTPDGEWDATHSVMLPVQTECESQPNYPLISSRLWPDIFLDTTGKPTGIETFGLSGRDTLWATKSPQFLIHRLGFSGYLPFWGAPAFPSDYGTFSRFDLEDFGPQVIGPFDKSVTAGEPAVLAISTSGPADCDVQWYHNGVALAGATTPYLQFADTTTDNAGIYHVEVSTPDGTVTSSSAELMVAPNGTRLINLSARSRVATDTPQTAGFVLTGSGNHEVFIRSLGQTLGLLAGTALADASLLGAPNLTLDPYSDANEILTALPATDANIVAVANRVGAFAAIDSDPANIFFDGAALHGELTSTPHTLQVSPADNSSGLGLLEIYDASSDSLPALTNVSLRATAGRGNDVLTGGFVITGEGPVWMLLRAIGPGLSNFGIRNHLSNPSLQLFKYSEALIQNDDWADTPALAAATEAVGAFPLEPGSADAALLVKLSPGAYTAQVLLPGNEEPAEALLEIYFVGSSPVSNN